MTARARVRDAREDEGALLHEILVRAFDEYRGRLDPPSGVHAETVASIARKLREGGALICEEEGVAVGCVFLEPRTHHLYVGRLAVLPEHRRRGLGGLLLAAAERHAVARGLPRVRLAVRVPLASLRDFYQARGYVPVAFRSHEGYAQATYVEMEKLLDPRAPG
jgi:predicted N-acetyltransferase YhbS